MSLDQGLEPHGAKLFGVQPQHGKYVWRQRPPTQSTDKAPPFESLAGNSSVSSSHFRTNNKGKVYEDCSSFVSYLH